MTVNKRYNLLLLMYLRLFFPIITGIGIFIQSSNVALANNSLIIANRHGGIPNFACFSGSTASGVGQLIDCNGLDISRKSGDLFVVQYGSAGEFEVRVNGTFNMSYEGVYSCRMTDHLGQIMDFNFGIYTQGSKMLMLLIYSAKNYYCM